jgi:hypothetical protein
MKNEEKKSGPISNWLFNKLEKKNKQLEEENDATVGRLKREFIRAGKDPALIDEIVQGIPHPELHKLPTSPIFYKHQQKKPQQKEPKKSILLSILAGIGLYYGVKGIKKMMTDKK